MIAPMKWLHRKIDPRKERLQGYVLMDNVHCSLTGIILAEKGEIVSVKLQERFVASAIKQIRCKTVIYSRI